MFGKTKLPLLVGLTLLAGCSIGLREPKTADKLRAAPEFSLPNEQGRAVTLASLLKGGKAVIVFYRGHW